MPACAFFGNTKDKDITVDTLDAIADLFEYLIVKKGVRVFYSTAKTDFDSACEGVIGILKKEHPDIELIKIAGKNDKKQRDDPAYDHIINFENNNYRKRYRYTSRLVEYILIDTVVASGPRDTLFSDILFTNRHRMDDVNIITLKWVMRKREEYYKPE